MAKRNKISGLAFWGQIAGLFLCIMTMFFWFVPFIRINLLGGSSTIEGFDLAFGGTAYWITTGVAEPIKTPYDVFSVPGLTVSFIFLVVTFVLIIAAFVLRKLDDLKGYKALTYVACVFLLVSSILCFCAQPMFESSAKDPLIKNLITDYKTTGNFLIGGMSLITLGVNLGVSFAK